MCCMTTMTLSVPDDIKKQMKQFPQVNWSAIARDALNKELERQQRLEEIKRRLTQEDTEWAISKGRKLKSGRAQELKKRGLIK